MRCKGADCGTEEGAGVGERVVVDVEAGVVPLVELGGGIKVVAELLSL